jgi:hypothetical protein
MWALWGLWGAPRVQGLHPGPTRALHWLQASGFVPTLCVRRVAATRGCLLQGDRLRASRWRGRKGLGRCR